MLDQNFIEKSFHLSEGTALLGDLILLVFYTADAKSFRVSKEEENPLVLNIT